MNKKRKKRSSKSHQYSRRKTTLSEPYKNEEKEVADLLRNAKEINLSESEYLDEQIDFFRDSLKSEIGHDETVTSSTSGKSQTVTTTVRKPPRKRFEQSTPSSSSSTMVVSSKTKTVSSKVSRLQLGLSTSESPTSLDPDQSSSHSSTESISTVTRPAASFIEIEETSPMVKATPGKIILNGSEFYMPSPNANFTLRHDPSEGELFALSLNSFQKKRNLVRMVNRFHMEDKHNLILSANALKNLYNFAEDSNLYKTVCERNFEPIFFMKSLYENKYSFIFSHSKKVMTISFKKLMFQNHPLQTDEHILAQKLQNFYSNYYTKKFSRIIGKYEAELSTLRQVVANLLEENEEIDLEDEGSLSVSYSNDNMNSPEDLLVKGMKESQTELEDYMKQIQFLRDKLHKEQFELKGLIQNILNTWISLKNLRKTQGFHWTDVKLLVIVEKSNIEEEEKLWNENFQMEYEEIVREESFLYEIRKKKLKHQDYRSSSKDRKLTRKNLKKPKPEAIKKELKEKLLNCIKLPGEPNIDFRLDKIRSSEKLKRPDKIKEYFLKMSFDGDLVEITKPTKMENFIVDINKTFCVSLERRIPENIKISIYEKEFFQPDVKIASIHLPFSLIMGYTKKFEEPAEFLSKNGKIAGKLDIQINCDVDDLNYFNSSETNRWKENSIGKFSQFTKSNLSSSQLKNLETPKNLPKLLPGYTSVGSRSSSSTAGRNLKHSSISTITEYSEESQAGVDDGEDDDDTFVLNEDLMAFCSQKEIDNNVRLRMLKLRYQNDMKYKDFRFIPLLDSEFAEEDQSKIIEDGDWMDPIDVEIYRGKKYLRRLYDTVWNYSIQLNQDEDISHSLIGNEPPTFKEIISAIFSIFGAARPLNPIKTDNKQPISMISNRTDCFNVIINVVRATGVPVRNFAARSSTNRESSTSSLFHQSFNYDNVRPFVSVSYRDKVVRTITVEGSNPTWNEQMSLQISGNMVELKEDLKIELFDEYIEDLLNEDLSQGLEVYQRIHMNWLGELRIPINVLFKQQQIEGVFELNSPAVLLKYSKPSLDPTVTDSISLENIPEIRESVYLTLYITIEPRIENFFKNMNTNYFECSELRETKAYINNWCIDVKQNYPDKFFNPLICLANGKTVCITRLLEPIPLPFQMENGNEGLSHYIRRFVSLIPVLKIMTNCSGLNGIWLTNELILDTGWASPKDLGVLLACYYLTLGIQVWLVLGVSMQYGETTFVLLKEEEFYVIVDPCTGRKYFSKDVYCPLLQVFLVVGRENVYCNIQSEKRISMIDFNIDDTRNWMPLFNKINPAPTSGVQKMNYNYKSNLPIDEIRKNIERKVMKKINSWRSTRKTVWNRAYQGLLEDILNELEDEMVFRRSCENYMEKITKRISHYKVFGFSVNFTYINLSSISDYIRSTGIHMNADRNVQFSVAVSVFQYPNNILSVWIFLMSMVPLT